MEAQRLVLISLAQESDRDLGVDVDVTNLDQSFRPAFERSGRADRFLHLRVPHEEQSPEGIAEFIRKSAMRPSDAVLFFTTSHGGYDPRKGHFVYLRGRKLFLVDVRAFLRAEQPHAVFILTDACSSLRYTPAEPLTRTRSAAERPGISIAPACWETVRDLFLRQPRGTVVQIAAAGKGLPALCNKVSGGKCTNAFLRILSQPRAAAGDGHALWKDFFGAVELETIRLAWVEAQKTQVPELLELGVPPDLPPPGAGQPELIGLSLPLVTPHQPPRE